MPEVLAIIEKTATTRRTVVEGTMVPSVVGHEWSLPAGKAVKTALIRGRPSSLYVECAEARASILKALGVDLGRSPTYRKCR